jgi:y4mF family transcriptional regulator
MLKMHQNSRKGKFMTENPTALEQIGWAIRRIRKAQGLRQAELAGYANVGTRFVVDLEAGKPTIQMGKAIQVLETLGCKLQVVPPPDSGQENKS